MVDYKCSGALLAGRNGVEMVGMPVCWCPEGGEGEGGVVGGHERQRLECFRLYP
jgi:hypothetical protein